MAVVDEYIMQFHIHIRAWLFIIIFCNLTLANNWHSPEKLIPFWSGINPDWIPLAENEYWKESDRIMAINYCRIFAKRSNAANLLPAIIDDLKAHPSIVRSYIYTWLVLNWNKDIVIPILKPYLSGSDPEKRRIAADFVAEIEENIKNSQAQ